ncbi:MAG TPA: hypothetical protein VIF62_24550, partial [Labilithrix sp.]
MRGIAACLVAGVAGGAFAFACGSSGGGGDQTIVDSGTPETTTPPPSDAADDRTFPIDAPANEQVLGGGRLKPKVMRTSDGASAFVAWHDIMLDIDCAFSVAQDGALRCLPNEAAENGYGNTWLREWTDMTCTTTPMLLDKRDGYDACPPPKYFASRDEAMCPGKVRVEPIGAQLAATKYSYEDRMQPCQPNNSLSPPDVAWSLGAVVPPETFVRGTLSLSDPKDG